MFTKDTCPGYFSSWKHYRKRAQLRLLQRKHAGLTGTEGDREGETLSLLSQYQTFPMSVSVCDSPQPPLSCPVHTCQYTFLFPPLSSHLLLFSLPLPSHRGDQLTATSWGGLEASCPCPRDLLASSLNRMDRDGMIHSHMSVYTQTCDIYKVTGGFTLTRKTGITAQFT